MDYVLLGPPGAGKGTIAKLLVKQYGYEHLSTGDLIRAELKKTDSKLGDQIRSIVESGGLVDDITVEKLLSQRLAEVKAPVLFDGYPRNLTQAARLAEILESRGRKLGGALALLVEDDEIVSRLTNRRSCPVCGRVYNLKTNPPGDGFHCDDDNSELTKRADDSEETVRHRLSVYHENTEPLIDFYKERDSLLAIDGLGSISVVMERTCAILDSK
ncbi:adenylate kinase [bacterium]|nr:adenylate kinase [bacterium]